METCPENKTGLVQSFITLVREHSTYAPPERNKATATPQKIGNVKVRSVSNTDTVILTNTESYFNWLFNALLDRTVEKCQEITGRIKTLLLLLL